MELAFLENLGGEKVSKREEKEVKQRNEPQICLIKQPVSVPRSIETAISGASWQRGDVKSPPPRHLTRAPELHSSLWS